MTGNALLVLALGTWNGFRQHSAISTSLLKLPLSSSYISPRNTCCQIYPGNTQPFISLSILQHSLTHLHCHSPAQSYATAASAINWDPLNRGFLRKPLIRLLEVCPFIKSSQLCHRPQQGNDQDWQSISPPPSLTCTHAGQCQHGQWAKERSRSILPITTPPWSRFVHYCCWDRQKH